MRTLRPLIFALKEGSPLLPNTFPIGAQFIVPQNLLPEEPMRDLNSSNTIAFTTIDAYKSATWYNKILVDGRNSYNDEMADFLNLITQGGNKQVSVVWNISHDAKFTQSAIHRVHTHFTAPLNPKNAEQVTEFYKSFSKLSHIKKPFIGIAIDCGKEDSTDYAKAHTAISLARTLNQKFSEKVGITAAISGVNAVGAQYMVDYFAYLNSKGATNYGRT